jgi:hypothetical protein
MTREEIEAGLHDGTLERGVTRRYARGIGDVPEQGELLMPERVQSITPPVRDREVTAWLVVGEATRAIVPEIRWGAPVVGRPGGSSRTCPLAGWAMPPWLAALR